MSTTRALVTSSIAIQTCRDADRAALIGYLPFGYPDITTSIAAARAMVHAGVDIVEFGLPYTDPVLDGPVIQQAAEQALARGVRTRDIFGAVESIAGTGAAVLVMSYYNPILRYGVDSFARDLASAGGAGLITPDLVPDEGSEWIAASDAHELDRVFLVAPSSTPERLALTAQATRGFVYAASVMGVTGTRTSVGDAAERLVADTRAAGAENVCVGLGVSTPDQAAEIARYADGVIVGSALVRALGPEGDLRALERTVAALSGAVGK